MKGKSLAFVIALMAVLAVVVTAWADDCCGDCEERASCTLACYTCETCECYGTESYIKIGIIAEKLEGSRDSFYDPGYYPEDWVVSSRLHFADGYSSGERFELRLQDVSDETYRGWARLALWPLTYEVDSTNMDNYGWDQLGGGFALQSQEVQRDQHKLRVHKGELDNMVVAFDKAKWSRTRTSHMLDYGFERLTYKYNFDLADGRIKGQAGRVAQSVAAPRLGPGAYNSETSSLKLDVPLNDEFSVFGRGNYTYYDYQDLPDNEFDSHDYTLGFRYQPNWCWEVGADYHAKQYATDNTVSSHVEDVSDYGVEISYAPGGSSRYEAGFRHSDISYAQLHMETAPVATLIRSAAVPTPAMVAVAVTDLSPQQDEIWFAVSRKLHSNLTYSNWLSYKDGDMPGTDLVALGSPSLFYDTQFDFRNTLTYDVNGNDQLAVTTYDQESMNQERNGDFDMHSFEASWSRCVGGNGYLTLMYRGTEYEVETPNVGAQYTTDDTTYLANFSQDLPDFRYGLNVSLTNGSGSEEYDQLGAGADFKFKSLGPVRLRVDWFDRDYTAHPIFDTEAVEVMVTYRLDF